MRANIGWVYLKKLTLIVALLFFVTCKKKKQVETEPYPVPIVLVNITLFPNDATNFKIQPIGGWMYYPGAGYQGLIIYRKSPEEFTIIERASPVSPNNAGSAVKVQADNFTLKDTVNATVWQIVDGAVMNNSTKWPLRTFPYTYDGNKLIIRN